MIPGGELLFAHEMTAIRQDENGVEATVKTPDGEARFSGRYLIGADGGRSTVRRLLGIPFEGYTHPKHFLVSGTTFDFKSVMPEICSVNYTADPMEWYLLLEIPDMWRAIVPVDTTIEATDGITDDCIQGCLQNLLPRSEPYDIVVRGIYRVSQRVAPPIEPEGCSSPAMPRTSITHWRHGIE